MKRILFILVFISIIFSSCEDDDVVSYRSFSTDYDVIEIKTFRDPENLMGESNRSLKLKSTYSDDPFIETKDVETSESVVMPEFQPHIWLGNILKKSSIINCDYYPLIYPRSPISVGLTLPGTDPGIIKNPSFTSINAYLQKEIPKGTFQQNGEFSFTVEQFYSYHELKSAFGSNANTSSLFWSSSSSESKTEHTISKATGLYVKFFQTSFKAIMDYPTGKIADIPNNLIDSAVYINSITYGRLGILTLETNYTASEANTIINKVFKKLFVSGSSTFTKEESDFLDGADFKLYLIGGNGKTSVETFQGYTGFINHIKSGKFSKQEPGAPLFCTFNHVKDNTPVKVKFRFNIKRQPIYVEMKLEKRSDSGIRDFVLYFYKSRSRVPAIAHPAIQFKVKCFSDGWHRDPNNPMNKPSTKYYYYQNAPQNTSLKIMEKVIFDHDNTIYVNGRPVEISNIRYEYTLEKNDGYEVIGKTFYDNY